MKIVLEFSPHREITPARGIHHRRNGASLDRIASDILRRYGHQATKIRVYRDEGVVIA